MSELIRERVKLQPRISVTQNFETDENVEKNRLGHAAYTLVAT